MNGIEHENSPVMTGKSNTEIISKMIKDMRFVGVFSIISGVINCLSIIGAVVGIPLIFIGMRLRDAAMEFERYMMTNEIDAIFSGFEKQQRAFFISKSLIIISIIFVILYVIVMFFIFSQMWLNAVNGFE